MTIAICINTMIHYDRIDCDIVTTRRGRVVYKHGGKIKGQLFFVSAVAIETNRINTDLRCVRTTKLEIIINFYGRVAL